MMLVVLLSIFLATELPQGILAIMNALFPSGVQSFIYMSLGEILDLLSLINCNACFDKIFGTDLGVAYFGILLGA
uniref:Uncharacterized protein n=1 Tax=Acrobeloides nanus TaxID=290746 RepID=A0A914DRF2_9BILA